MAGTGIAKGRPETAGADGVHPTHCRVCPTGCGVLVDVADGTDSIRSAHIGAGGWVLDPAGMNASSAFLRAIGTTQLHSAFIRPWRGAGPADAMPELVPAA